MNCQHRMRSIIGPKYLIEKQTMHSLLPFTFTALFFFFYDLFFAALLGHQIFYGLFIFTLISIGKDRSRYKILLNFFLLAVETFIHTGLIGLPFCLYVVFFLISRPLLDRFASQKIAYSITLVSFLLTSLAISLISSAYPIPSLLYTMFRIAGNLILLFFSLKWLSAVGQGNRF